MQRLTPLFYLISFAVCIPASAQVSNPQVRYVSSAPSGSCSQSPPVQVLNSSGAIYTCNNGTWGISGGGTATPSGPAGGVLSGTYPNPGLSVSAQAIPNGWTATTQAPGTNNTTVSSTAYADASAAAAGALAFPKTVSGTTTSGGIPYLSSTTQLSSSGILNVNILVKGGGAGAAPSNSSVTDNGTNVTTADTGGYVGPTFTANGNTAGFVDFPQGTTSVAVAPCNTANSICEQAPTSVTAYMIVKPGTGANGTLTNNVTAAVDTQGFSGDTNHSATVTIGSGTSIGSTSLCSTAICTVGTYRVNVYVDITTACGTTGTYVVNLIYTDDQGSKTIPVNIQGSGSVPLTGVLTTTSTANFGAEAQIIRSTGAASINYSTTAGACGTAGPMVGKLYLSVEPIQ